MKTSELTGSQLDYWVAKAEEFPSAWIVEEEGGKPRCILGPAVMDRFEWSPSEAWEQGGPIIERERINLHATHLEDWRAWTDPNGRIDRGDTPLIAAMRAYVSSKFGEEVPEEKGKKVHRA